MSRSAGNTVQAVQIASATTQRSKEFLRFDGYGEPDQPMAANFYVWPVFTSNGVILLDTGFTQRSADQRGQIVTHELPEALAAVDLVPSDVRTIVCSHLHYDHTGSLDLFPGAEIVVQTAEVDLWFSGLTERPLYRGLSERDDLAALRRADADGRLRRITGAVELAPGVSTVPLPGHTPGSQGLRVETERRPVVLASDAIHYYEELERDWTFIIVDDVGESYRTVDRLRQFEAGGDVVVPGHAAEVTDRFETRQARGGPVVVTLC